MVELLSEYEATGNSLLMKHRDHYSHSVYVFALGLAIYECSESYRDKFRDFYGLGGSPENERANRFLEFWGLTSLFHNIGYPFELPFEQVQSYFEVNNQERGKGYLNAIPCFYTDKPVDFPLVTRFDPGDAAIFAPLEHERWVREQLAMGWQHGEEYEKLPLDVPEDEKKNTRRALREQLRMHKLVMPGRPTSRQIAAHYRELDESDRNKDWKPFNNLLKQFDGLRIYRL